MQKEQSALSVRWSKHASKIRSDVTANRQLLTKRPNLSWPRRHYQRVGRRKYNRQALDLNRDRPKSNQTDNKIIGFVQAGLLSPGLVLSGVEVVIIRSLIQPTHSVHLHGRETDRPPPIPRQRLRWRRHRGCQHRYVLARLLRPQAPDTEPNSVS